MTNEEARELRTWLTEQFSERLHELEKQSQRRGEQMHDYTESVHRLEVTNEAIIKRLDRIDGYFATLVNIRTFIVWSTPIITTILIALGVIWSLN